MKNKSKNKNTNLENLIYQLNPSIKAILSTPLLNYWEHLEHISVTNHLRCSFAEIGCVGVERDITKAQKIFINSIIYN